MQKTTWISHRGLRDVENTKESFQSAVGKGFVFLETDLRVTKDGQIVLCHDEGFGRVGGPQVPVHELTREQVAEIELGEQKRNPMFFDQFIDLFAGLSWTLDIKPEQGFTTISKLVDWAKSHSAEEWIQSHAQFLLWNKKQQDFLMTHFPKARCYARRFECYGAALRAKFHLPFAIERDKTYASPVFIGNWKVMTKEFVDTFHKAGARVCAFLPENANEARVALESGVDEILTNYEIVT